MQPTRNKPRLIEPELLPKWGILQLNRQVLLDRFYEALDTPEPSQSMVNFLKRQITDKNNQLKYYNFKFN